MKDFKMKKNGRRILWSFLLVLLISVWGVGSLTAAEPTQGGDSALSTAETPEPAAASSATAWLVSGVDMQPGRAVFVTEGKVEKFLHFTLADPARLVVDLYGVRPSFSERVFAAQAGFSQVRVGTYQDRTRFVFDAAASGLPNYHLARQADQIVLIWDGGRAVSTVPSPSVASRVGGRVDVTAINFAKDGGKSQLIIDLSGPAAIEPAVKQGNLVRFGVNNASISQALRRTFDSHSFPSAMLRATPYTVMNGKRQDVRFAVELKGDVSYQLLQQPNKLILVVDDGAYTAPATASNVPLPVPVSSFAPAVQLAAAPVAEVDGAQVPLQPLEKEVVYTGEKIQLVFDDADVRDIFQLIAEVSDLNIIVSDEVKGSITLRLIDVPWDQALDLILETKNLGMLKKGNVVRVLPKEQIRSMEEAKFTAARNKEKLEDLVTEVVPVSYTAIKNVEGPSKELMTERGKLTADDRNKQIIVTDIPSVITAIKKLVAILDTPERQVMIEARIVEADSTFNRNLGVNWGFGYADRIKDSFSEAIDAGANSGWLGDSNLGFGGNFIIPPAGASMAQAAGIGGGIQFAKFAADALTLDLRLSAMESQGSGKIISRPRVTTLNGEKAKISQGTMIPYQTVSNDEITTELVEAALSLEVTPVINPDNSIILDIKATNSSPGTTVATGAGAAPEIDSKEAETKVLVKDGETTVIGGIFVENNDFAENGVPILRSIPFLGNLFKSTQKNNLRSELLIFITPRIIK
ncbi:type IV pilus secretin family protein [Trichloromonas acetexigens]|uniref:Type IV pilus secretin PilQ n=1 Tax=Trichloromonas acetexigens TaxID=38815 RepID=A0A550JLM6_9BACT|nr:type IV pilus secretin family protein [Desulfuromonas acetexigens]TRO84118.1 type IV pilus secretin PilQ [Desulfuromonas acetexigens]